MFDACFSGGILLVGVGGGECLTTGRDGVVLEITDCYIGSLFSGNINDPTADPGGLIQQSVDNGLPVVYVAMNYRLNSK